MYLQIACSLLSNAVFHKLHRMLVGKYAMESPEYLSIDDAAKAIGWNRATVYKYVDELGMKKYKFRLNRKTYLVAADVEKLKHIKEKPWLAGIEEERVGPKAEKDAAESGLYDTAFEQLAP